MQERSSMAAANRLFFALAAATLLATTPARAGDPAAAEELFQEGRELMRTGKLDLACKKLEESYALDAGSGTLFNLALCYEAQGRIATAWATYRDVAAATKAAGQPERERVAHDRAAVLEPRVAHVIIVAPADIEVRRDGAAVGPSQRGVPIPVDPGTHEIVASAPRRVELRKTIVITRDAQEERVEIPELEAVSEESAPPPPPAEEPPKPSAANPTMPLALGAAGVVAIGVGTFFGLRSIAQHGDSNPHCEANVCDQTGFDLRKDAIVSGNVSTAFIGVGAGLLALGAVLWFTASPAASARALRGGELRW
jgi:hypothetical protein